MLKNRSDILGSGKINKALGGLGLAIGQGVIIDYPIHQLIGYYTGHDRNSTGLGFAKNLNKKEIKGWVSYDTEFPKAREIFMLEADNVIRELNGVSLEEEVKQIEPNTLVEVVLWPDIGYIGYWNGIGDNKSINLNLVFDKKGGYADIFNLAPFLGIGETNPNLRYEAPNLQKVAVIYTLRVQDNKTPKTLSTN